MGVSLVRGSMQFGTLAAGPTLRCRQATLAAVIDGLRGSVGWLKPVESVHPVSLSVQSARLALDPADRTRS